MSDILTSLDSKHQILPVFIHSESNSNPIKIQLSKEVNCKGIVLTEFSMVGYPTTNGIPDDLFVTLELTRSNLSSQEWVKNDLWPGIMG